MSRRTWIQAVSWVPTVGAYRGRYLGYYSEWMASDERGSDAVKRRIGTVARAAQALRDVVAAIDAGEVPEAGALRNYLVGVVVALDMLTAERAQGSVR